VVIKLLIASAAVSSICMGAPASAIVLSGNIAESTYDTELVDSSTFVTSGFSTGSGSSLTLEKVTIPLAMRVSGLAQLDLYTSTPGSPG
jgi:hypothetical protein